jgi:Fe-S cluster assembly protein SufD
VVADVPTVSVPTVSVPVIVPSLVWPTSANELWRYSRIDTLRVEGLKVADGNASSTLHPEPIGEVAASVHLVDGVVRSVELSDAARAAGLQIQHSKATHSPFSLDSAAPSFVVDGGDVFVEFATSVATDAVVIDVPRGKAIPGVVQIINEVASAERFVASHLCIRLGETAELSVIERVVGSGAGSVFVPVTHLMVGNAATLRFVSIQELGDECVQIAHQQTTTGRDATLRSMSVALGGSYARVRTDAVITDQGGFNELLAVYFGAQSQMHDFRTLQHHIAPRTTSELLFKGAVEDASQSVYSGLIRIGVDAKQTVANQTNRNLLLSPNASAESVPNLEIENNDVKCSHASAVGPVDNDQMYYLESRGVTPEDAEQLIVVGFFADVLERSPIPGVAEALSGVFADKFAQRSGVSGS